MALLEVAHFEPVKVTVRGRGIFPCILLNTPGADGALVRMQRRDEEDYGRRLAAAHQRALPAPAGGGAAEESVRLELEIDRNFLCETLLEKEQEALRAKKAGAHQSSTASTKHSIRQMKDVPLATVAHYTCDFGNIVLGQSGKKVYMGIRLLFHQ